MKDLTVFVLTHNRPDLVQIAIESILNQKPFDFKFVVSDNSDNDETERILKEKSYFSKINYYHTTANGAERWTDIFSRLETTYFMVFHDDDEMYDTMVANLYDTIIRSGAKAVGANADVHISGRYSKKFLNEREDIFIESIETLAKNWLISNIVPFPSYIYEKSCIECFPWTFPAGKNSDSVFIGNIVSYLGPVIWLHEPQMIYNIHSSQDSAIWDYLSCYGLLCYYRNRIGKENCIINKYRIELLYELLKKDYKERKIISKYKIRLLYKYNKILFIRFLLRFILKR